METIPVKASLSRHFPAHTVVLPCDRCGGKVPTARMYLSAKAADQMVKGYYPSMSFRLCRPCLDEAIGVLDVVES
jgi:hypothetical protein